MLIFGCFSAFYGQRSVSETWTNPSPWSIYRINEQFCVSWVVFYYRKTYEASANIDPTEVDNWLTLS